MAKKIATKAIEELPRRLPRVGYQGGKVIEHDLTARVSPGNGRLRSRRAPKDLFPFDEGFLGARDELEAKFGGREAMLAAAGKSTPAGKFGIDNIRAIGVDFRSAGGYCTGELAVKVYVLEKNSGRTRGHGVSRAGKGRRVSSGRRGNRRGLRFRV